ncbi:uncharacterized protein LOC134025244 [Osmerus eperlanus]|uniref:uncharacterized protein LOC134025244 n=1 Tax=Osmerus eperlanus TaxID=29151 RepID=UPI002E14AFC9
MDRFHIVLRMGHHHWDPLPPECGHIVEHGTCHRAPSPQARSRHEARSREAPSPQVRSRHEDPSPQARSRHDARSREAPSPQARSRHDARSREAPSPQARSRHDARSREAPSPQARSRHEDPSPQARSRHDARSREAPSPQARSRHDARSRHSDLSSPPYHRPETGRWAFPLPCGVFQKKVLSLLVDIRHRLKDTQPASSAVHIERIETMEDFELKEQHLSDAQAFDTLS